MARIKCDGPRIKSGGGIAYVDPKTSEPFYQSAAFKAWRAGVLQRAGNRCEGPGPHSGSLFADHIVERKDGGADLDPGNGQALCFACHNRKTAKVRSERRFG